MKGRFADSIEQRPTFIFLIRMNTKIQERKIIYSLLFYAGIIEGAIPTKNSLNFRSFHLLLMF